tara:strand:+ start:736 stop:1200 length:465 start_codon:yes stop_codon:yes gene_type:complete
MVFRRTKMHIAFYVDSNGGTPQNRKIYEVLNKAVDDKKVKDASIFFNYVDFNPVSNKFGMFDAADMWSFTGNLIATTMENVESAANIVNKFKLSYLYSEQDKERFGIFRLFNLAKSIPIITTSQEETEEVLRITGVEPKQLTNFSIEEIEGVWS